MVLDLLANIVAVPYLLAVKVMEWRALSRVRVAAARLRGAHVGTGVTIERGVYLAGARNIRIGNSVYLGVGSSIVAYESEVTIGDGSLVAAGCRIISRNHAVRSGHGLLAEAGFESRPVNIGCNVWLGYDVIVLPGVTIGDDAVVGAGAVVTKSVEPSRRVVGVPARSIPASTDPAGNRARL